MIYFKIELTFLSLSSPNHYQRNLTSKMVKIKEKKRKRLKNKFYKRKLNLEVAILTIISLM